MGIIGFQPWLRTVFGGEKPKGPKSRYFYDLQVFLASNRKKKVRRTFIDLNALIHNAVSEVFDTDDEETREVMYQYPDRYWLGPTGIFQTILNTIYIIVMITKPQELLYLAADGVVTKAKMQQQRERSYATLVLPAQAFDRTQIKPGTQFMNSLSEYIKANLPSMWKQNPKLWPRKVEFSDASIPGEGEHKIMRTMYENKPKTMPRDFRDAIDIVYSPDSDMALLTMLHASVDDQVIVMRQQHNYIPSDDDIGRWEYYDATGIRSDLKSVYGISHVLDFILLTIFAGNDFLPGLPCTLGNRLDAFDFLMQAYMETFRNTLRQPNLVAGRDVNWDNVRIYLNYFTIFQQVLLKNMYIDQFTGDKFTKLGDDGEEVLDDRRLKPLEVAMVEVEQDVLDPSGRMKHVEGTDFDTLMFKNEYHRYISGIWGTPQSFGLADDVELFQVRNMAKAYLGGIDWILGYYLTQEQNVNVRWSYAYSYAPTVHDLVDVLDSVNPASFLYEARLPNKEMATPVEHLLAILPESKLGFVPKVVESAFTNYMPDLYPSAFVIDYNGVAFSDDKSNEVHKARVLINTPSLERIHRIFEQFKDDPSVKGAMGAGKMWRRTVKQYK